MLFRVEVEGYGLCVIGFEFRVYKLGLGFKVWGLGARVQG